jgi:hypothetical protein
MKAGSGASPGRALHVVQRPVALLGTVVAELVDEEFDAIGVVAWAEPLAASKGGQSVQ